MSSAQHNLVLADRLATQFLSGRSPVDQLHPTGLHYVELMNKYGAHKIEPFWAPNAITNTARTAMLEAWFNSGTRYSSYYAGCINSVGFVGIPNTDTMASHSGWTEFTAYKDVADSTVPRITWGKGTAANQQVTNTSQMIFTFTGTGVVAGIFVTTNSGKSDFSSGLLWSTALFVAGLAVDVDDILRVTYTVTT